MRHLNRYLLFLLIGLFSLNVGADNLILSCKFSLDDKSQRRDFELGTVLGVLESKEDHIMPLGLSYDLYRNKTDYISRLRTMSELISYVTGSKLPEDLRSNFYSSIADLRAFIITHLPLAKEKLKEQYPLFENLKGPSLGWSAELPYWVQSYERQFNTNYIAIFESSYSPGTN